MIVTRVRDEPFCSPRPADFVTLSTSHFPFQLVRTELQSPTTLPRRYLRASWLDPFVRPSPPPLSWRTIHTDNLVFQELDPSLVYSVLKVRHLSLDRADQVGELNAAHPNSFCECRRWSPSSRPADLTIETRIGAGGHISPNGIRSAIQYAVLRCRPLLLFVCSPLFGLDGAVERSGSELAFWTQRSLGRSLLRSVLCSQSF